MKKEYLKTAEIMRKVIHFRIRKFSTKFHIKVRNPHFKLRKAIFKRGLEKNCKKKFLEKEDLMQNISMDLLGPQQ